MTRLQRRTFQVYLQFRGRPMTIGRLFWANRRAYAISLSFFAAFAWFVYSAYGSFGASYVGVALAVMLLRDIGYFRRSAASWPVLQEVLDWTKIENLAAAQEAPPKPEAP